MLQAIVTPAAAHAFGRLNDLGPVLADEPKLARRLTEQAQAVEPQRLRKLDDDAHRLATLGSQRRLGIAIEQTRAITGCRLVGLEHEHALGARRQRNAIRCGPVGLPASTE